MKSMIRVLACSALVVSLGACVVATPTARPNPRELALQRYGQINERLDNLGRRIDWHVNNGYYPPPQGNALHRRLDVLRSEARDMASQHGGGLSGEEQRVLNHELDGAARAIGE